jgi:hypothetical protein
MLRFWVILTTAATLNFFSFMGLAFSAGGAEPKAGSAMAKLLAVYSQTATILINVHYLVMPIYFIATIGVFFWKSRHAGLVMAKFGYALPAVSFACIALYFFISARVDG